MIVFPATNSNKPEERLIIEYNLTNIINSLVDKSSFIISYDPNKTGIELGYLVFNIKGYYFNCSINDVWGTNSVSGNLYANINLSIPTDNISWQTISPNTDNNNLFVNFTPTEPTTGYWIQLFKGGKINEDAYIKFTTGGGKRSVVIDDGNLDT